MENSIKEGKMRKLQELKGNWKGVGPGKPNKSAPVSYSWGQHSDIGPIKYFNH